VQAADEAFERLSGHFTVPVLRGLLAERRLEIAQGLFSGMPVVSGEQLLAALYSGEMPHERVRFYVNRVKYDFKKLGFMVDDKVRADVIEKTIRQGATLVFNRLEQRFETPGRLSALLGEAIGHTIEVSAVLSFTDRSGIPPHHDDENLFIAQLEGEKEWVLLGEPVPEGVTQRVYSGPEGEPRSLTLHAGDVMFLPAGQRHYCNPSPGGSLHLAFLIEAPSGATALGALSTAIAADADLNRPYLALATDERRAELRAGYRARLHALVDELDLAAVLANSQGASGQAGSDADEDRSPY